MIILGTKSEKYTSKAGSKHNGAHYYAAEIESIILPSINAEVFIVTAGGTLYSPKEVPDGSVVVCHDNHNPTTSYANLMKKDILWVCSKRTTVEKLTKHHEKAVYIPLSIDTHYVKGFRSRKDKDIAFVGNAWSFKKEYLANLPSHIDQLSGMPRDDLLREMARYKRVIAEGRCLMEAQVLGAKCEIPEYQDDTIGAEFVTPVDNREVVDQWRKALHDHAPKEPVKYLRTIKSFEDLEARRIRQAGEVFTVSFERAAEITGHKVKLVEVLN